jgi:hypothetical protein
MTNDQIVGRLAVLEILVVAALSEAMRGQRTDQEKALVLQAIRGPAKSRLSQKYVDDPVPEAARVEGEQYLDFLLAEYAQHMIPATASKPSPD